MHVRAYAIVDHRIATPSLAGACSVVLLGSPFSFLLPDEGLNNQGGHMLASLEWENGTSRADFETCKKKKDHSARV